MNKINLTELKLLLKDKTIKFNGVTNSSNTKRAGAYFGFQKGLVAGSVFIGEDLVSGKLVIERVG